MRGVTRVAVAVGLTAAIAAGAVAQSGRQSGSERGKEVLHIIVPGEGAGAAPALEKGSFELFDGGAPQSVESLQLDQSPATVVLLVDNTKTLKVSVDQLKGAAHALIDELYEGDRMMVVGYDESAYILQEFTTNLAELDATADDKFQKAGFPHLFDALAAVLADAFGSVGTEKRIVVLVSDGFDDGSKTKFEEIVARLQEENIVVYVLQAPDRTRNASRLDGPKPRAAVERLVEATGGRAFPLAEQVTAAKVITEEVRLNWYRAVYTPRGVDRLSERGLLIIMKGEGAPKVRTKAQHPGRKK